ncbi:MAG: PAS domain-containing protein, partial [bacterium]|nr:PAS domain-containing protein [bacterium]
FHNQNRPQTGCPMEKFMSSQKEERVELFEVTLNRWISVTVSPILDDTGKVDKIVHVVRDITERRKAEEALRQSEYSYRLLAENATDVIWTIDLQMKPTYFSPSITRLVGYTAEEAMQISMAEAFSARSYELARKVLAEEIAREKAGVKDVSRSRILEIELNHKNGSIIIAEIVFNFIRDQSGQPQGILAIARDITERTRMNDELQKRVRDLERFNKVTLEREKRIIELKKKLKDLEQSQHGQ